MDMENIDKGQIIKALSMEYADVFLLDKQECTICLTKATTSVIKNIWKDDKKFAYNDFINKFAGIVYSEDCERFIKDFEFDNILQKTSGNALYRSFFRIVINDIPTFHHMKYMPIDGTDKIIVGLKNIDFEKYKEVEYIQKLYKQHEESKKQAKNTHDALTFISNLVNIGFWNVNYNEDGDVESVFWSPKFRNILGFENEEDFPNTIETLKERVHPEDKKSILQLAEDASDENDTFSAEYRIMKKDGNYEWFDVRGIYTPTDGKLRPFFGTITNITEKKNSESDFNEKLAVILDNVEGGLCIKTLDDIGSFKYISDGVAKMQGYTVEEYQDVMKNSTAMNIYEEDYERVFREFYEQTAANDTHHIKYRVRHKDGSLLWVMDYGKVVTAPDGTKLIYSFMQNITSTENDRIKLDTERTLFRGALTNKAIFSAKIDIDDGYYYDEIYMPDGTPILASMGFSLPAEYDAVNNAYIEQNAVIFYDDPKRQGFSRDEIRAMYSEQNMFETLNYYVPSTDTYVNMLVLLGKDPITGHLILNEIAYDITDKIKAEKAKQQALEDALVMAERANKAKTSFLNNMSHDIRTPMNAIIGFTALASTHVSDKDKVIDYLKKIQTSSNHLLSLINDVLDMSRIESGKVKIEKTEVSLPQIMHDIKNIVQADIKKKQLELFFDAVDVQNEFIICDKLRLNQILLNCLSNSIKFTPAHGTVGLKIVQRPSNKPNWSSYEFHIKDTGIGMSKEFAEHIFEPFSREQTSTVSGIQGTGLGMSITKNIVDMMGGEIQVISEKNKGTEFIIKLNFQIAAGKKTTRLEIPALKSVHALVADDSFDTCETICVMLRKIGLQPDWTMSGKEAVLRAKHARTMGDPYGVYIIDWLMPDMNGVEVVRRIRREIGDNTPIIILTAYDWSEIEDEAREAGVTAFFAKPLFMSELHDLLEKASSPEVVKEEEQETESLTLNGMNILLVEDNEINREIAVEILGEYGANVDTAENGKIAVDIVSESPCDKYDLILMDIQMPIMDGYEATKAIHALEDKEKASLPIIAMTANAFEADKKLSMEANMDGYIAKPFDIKNLVKTIIEVKGKRAKPDCNS